MRRAIVLGALLVVVSPSLRADGPDRSRQDRAAQLTTRGLKLIQGGQVEAGIDQCESAYQGYASSAVLLRVAYCYEAAGRIEPATKRYRTVWSSSTSDAAERDFARDALRRLTGADPAAAVTTPPPAALTVPPPSSIALETQVPIRDAETMEEPEGSFLLVGGGGFATSGGYGGEAEAGYSWTNGWSMEGSVLFGSYQDDDDTGSFQLFRLRLTRRFAHARGSLFEPYIGAAAVVSVTHILGETTVEPGFTVEPGVLIRLGGAAHLFGEIPIGYIVTADVMNARGQTSTGGFIAGIAVGIEVRWTL